MRTGILLLMTLGACIVGKTGPGVETGKISFDADEPEQSCVDIVNEYRSRTEQPPLARWADGEDCAVKQAEDDAATGIAHDHFGACGELGQNTCPGWASVDQILGDCLSAMYQEGPSENGEWDVEHGHYMNMVSPDFAEVACGFYPMEDGNWWMNMNFR